MNTIENKPLWLAHVNSRNTPIDMATLALTIESFAAALQNQNIDLSCVSRHSPNPHHLVALLRTSLTFRDTLTGWYALRDFGVSYLRDEGFEPDRVMKGLDVQPSLAHPRLHL